MTAAILCTIVVADCVLLLSLLLPLLLLLFVYIHCLVIQADSAVQLSVAVQ